MYNRQTNIINKHDYICSHFWKKSFQDPVYQQKVYALFYIQLWLYNSFLDSGASILSI